MSRCDVEVLYSYLEAAQASPPRGVGQEERVGGGHAVGNERVAQQHTENKHGICRGIAMSMLLMECAVGFCDQYLCSASPHTNEVDDVEHIECPDRAQYDCRK